MLSLQLILRKVHLPVGIIQRLLQFILQRHIAFLHLLIDKQKHLDQRYLIIRQPVDHLRIVLIIHRVSRIDQLRHLIVQIDQLRKLPGRQLIRQMISVQRLDVGKPHRVIHLGTGIQILQKRLFLLVIPCRHDQRHHVGSAKIVFLHFLRLLHPVLQRRRNCAVTEHIGTVLGNQIRRNDNHQKKRRHNIAGGVGKPADHRNVRNKIPVFRLFHKIGKKHDHPRHQ